jgi:hypothetical protein
VPTRLFQVLALSTVLIWFRFSAVTGFWCRTCALAHQRRQLNLTIATAWFGIGIAFLLPVLGSFAVRQVRIARLGRPRAAPYDVGPTRRPLDPGRPVLLRAGILVPLAIATVMTISLLTGS